MDTLVQLVIGQPLGFAGIVLTIISLSLALFFYLRSRRHKEPCWAIRNEALIENFSSSLSELSVAYRGEDIENLSISRLVFWNNGRETIDKQDIAQADPLRIEPKEDIQLLDNRVICSNHEASQFSVKLMEGDCSATIHFDYLDKGHGVVIQVIHTGTESEHIRIAGSIKGVTCLKERKFYIPRYLPLPTSKKFDKKIGVKVRRRVVSFFFFIQGLVLLALSMLLLASRVNPALEQGLSKPPPPLITWILAIFALSFSIFTLIYSLQRFWGHVPAGLEAFEQDLIN